MASSGNSTFHTPRWNPQKTIQSQKICATEGTVQVRLSLGNHQFYRWMFEWIFRKTLLNISVHQLICQVEIFGEVSFRILFHSRGSLIIEVEWFP